MMRPKFSLATTSQPSRVSIKKMFNQRKPWRICNFRNMTWNGDGERYYKRNVMILLNKCEHLPSCQWINQINQVSLSLEVVDENGISGWLNSFVCGWKKTRPEPNHLSTSWILLLARLHPPPVMVGYHPKWILYCHHSSWDLHLNSFKCSSV